MIKSGYHLFKNHAKFIILAGIATALAQLALQLIQSASQLNRGGGSLLASLFVGLIGLIITIGWAKVLLKLVRGDGANWNDFKSQPEVWLRFIKAYLWYIGYMVAYGFIIALPFIIITIIGFFTNDIVLTVGVILLSTALVVTAIYFGVRYQFLKYIVLDYPDTRSHDLFKKAGAITKGNLVQLLGFGIILGLVNLLGFICLVVGLAVTLPTTKLAQVKVYEYLKEKHTV